MDFAYFEITDNYFEGLEKILEYIKSKAVKICRYSHNDINEICSMFCDTVKHINKKRLYCRTDCRLDGRYR